MNIGSFSLSMRSISLCLVISAFCSFAPVLTTHCVAQTRTINTYAGNGYLHGTDSGAYSGDGGPAIHAELNGPGGIAFDDSFNLYIADFANDRVRKVNRSSGIITTVAGNGAYYLSDSGAYSGDGGQATAASLYFPAGIAVDHSGDIFIADQLNNRVRRVDGSTGIITTVAGLGVAGYNGDGIRATNAMLYNPINVALDDAGNLYIADFNNSRVRAVNLSTGIISTVAGDGVYRYAGDGGPATAASMPNPAGLAIDAAGNIYVSDWESNTVRKIDATTKIISLFAGDTHVGHTGDGGPATAAEITQPLAIALDMNDNLYITDWNPSNKIRLVDHTTGIITTIAGDGIGGYSGDGGPATAAEMSYPDGLAFDGSGNLYISDADNNVIREIDSVGSNGIKAVNAVSSQFVIYPNPATNTIAFYSNSDVADKLTIQNAIGQIIFESAFRGGELTIDISSLVSGIYFASLQTLDGVQTKAFCKQ